MIHHLALSPVHTLTVAGRRVTFEAHRHLGPILLRADGEPRARQPGPRSEFWPAWERWRKRTERKSRSAP